MPTEHLKLLKEELEKIYSDDFYGALQVSYGCKNKGGVYSEEKCIRFGVENKVPLDQIPPEKRIPSTITIDGVEYKTDVYVAPKNPTVRLGYAKIDSSFSSEHGTTQTVTLCHDTGTGGVPPVVSPPVSHNRATVRPLRGGVSMAGPPPSGYVNTATLGAIVVDDIDGKIVGLTNSHVSSTPGGNYDIAQFIADDNLFPAYYALYDNITMYQQSSWDSGIVNNPANVIGTTKRSFPLCNDNRPNYIDAGIVNLSNSLLDTNSWDVISASFGGTPPPFATTAEIDAITTSTQIFKSGRTTGPIGPDNYSGCIIQITDTSVVTSIIGFHIDNTDPVGFSDVMLLESPSTTVGLGGDSGSGVYAKIGGVWKLIGLYFAGSGGQYGYVCRIDRIASLLKISAYTGGPIDANPGTKSYISLPTASYGGQVSASIDGKTYWQLGRVKGPENVFYTTLTLNMGTNGQSVTFNGTTYTSQHVRNIYTIGASFLYTIDCTPQSGYVFSTWQVDDGGVGTLWDDLYTTKVNAFVILSLSSNITITPVFVAT